MESCLIIQPIHEAGIAALEKIGLTPRFASQPDMKTVAREITDVVAVITRNAGLNRVMLQRFLPNETQTMRGLKNLEEDNGQTTKDVAGRSQRSRGASGATRRSECC